MIRHDALSAMLGSILGLRLDELNLACEMMMFHFGAYALHAQCLVRILKDRKILVTTLDYQRWDERIPENNDEWYFIEKYRAEILGGKVVSAELNPLHDLRICMDNGVAVELLIANGDHHYGEEREQWVFFKPDDESHPFVSVYDKSIRISCGRGGKGVEECLEQ